MFLALTTNLYGVPAVIPVTTYEVVRTLDSSMLGVPSPLSHLIEYDRMSELPFAGEVRGVHDTVIDVSEYDVIVGADITSGIRLILAPAVFGVEYTEYPNEL